MRDQLVQGDVVLIETQLQIATSLNTHASAMTAFSLNIDLSCRRLMMNEVA